MIIPPDTYQQLFPAHAGMTRQPAGRRWSADPVPRTSDGQLTVGPPVDETSRAAIRRWRSAAAFRIEASDVPAETNISRAAQELLVSLARRGRCDTLAAQSTQRWGTYIRHIQSRLLSWVRCPPGVVRLAAAVHAHRQPDHSIGEGPAAWSGRGPSDPTAHRSAVAAADTCDASTAARNPATPAAVLARLASDRSHQVRLAVAANPNTSQTTRAHLSADSRSDVRCEIAGNRSCGPALCAQIASDPDWEVLVALAVNPNCGSVALKRLALSSFKWARAGAAAHPDCPAQVLAELASDSDSDIRVLVAGNSACPETTLKHLERDPFDYVRDAAAETLRAVLDSCSLSPG